MHTDASGNTPNRIRRNYQRYRRRSGDHQPEWKDKYGSRQPGAGASGVHLLEWHRIRHRTGDELRRWSEVNVRSGREHGCPESRKRPDHDGHHPNCGERLHIEHCNSDDRRNDHICHPAADSDINHGRGHWMGHQRPGVQVLRHSEHLQLVGLQCYGFFDHAWSFDHLECWSTIARKRDLEYQVTRLFHDEHRLTTIL
jgi:hypothetical protein